MKFITVIRITNELPKLKRNEMKNNWPYYIKTEKYLKKKVHTEIWHQRGSLLALCVFVALKHSESSFKMDSILGHCEPVQPDLRTSSPLENCEISRASHFCAPLTLENWKNAKWKGLARVCRNFLQTFESWSLSYVTRAARFIYCMISNGQKSWSNADCWTFNTPKAIRNKTWKKKILYF